MNTVRLSYLIGTRNKLPYLKDSLAALINEKLPDEEILIGDGGSTDGTKEYLEELKRAGKIDYFVSQRDHGEAHALNALMLQAHGELLKVLTDDDVFYFPAIKACREFMLSHPEIDLLDTEGGSFHRTLEVLKEKDPLKLVRPLQYANPYKIWREKGTAFGACGLGMMWRKSSLPVLGFFSPGFYSVDAEFTLRNTYIGKASIAWYTGYTYVNVKNPQSVTWVHKKKVKDELDRLNKFYLDKNPKRFILPTPKLIVSKFKKIIHSSKLKTGTGSGSIFEKQWQELSQIAYSWLEIYNKKENPEFLWKSK